MDHGIESIEKRLEKGKREEGSIHLRAFHGEGHVFIEVQDDGGGIDSRVILQKALAKGLIDEKLELDEQETFRLLFNAGFLLRRMSRTSRAEEWDGCRSSGD